MTRDQAERALRLPAERYKDAKERLRLATNELKPYVKEARKAGVPIRTIVGVTGISSATVAVWERD